MEIMILILFLCVTDYSKVGMNGKEMTAVEALANREYMQTYYPMWQDLHVMIYIGFGFLMVFLKTSSWTAVGFNYLLAAFAFQWGILVVGFWDFVWATQGDLVNWEKIPLSLESLI